MSISTIITSKRAISAIVCLLSLAAMAATPVAVWDGDFTATQTGFTLNRSGNAISQDNSTITIDQSVGVTVDFTTGFSSAMTVMFKYSDLAFDAQKTLATSFCSGKDENRTGVYAASGGTINGIWNTANWDNPMETLSESSGVLAFCYGKSVGTSLYYIGTDGTRTQLYNKSNLVASTDPTINGCTIGGERAKSGATLLGAATGMKITGIAIFDGILTEVEMTNYDFPSEIQEHTLSLDGTSTYWSAGEWKIGTESVAAPLSGYATINLSASTTLTMDEAVSLKELTVQGEDGAVLTLVTGTGSLVANVSVTVKSGVLKQGSASVLGATPKLYVKDGATFDMNGLSINGSTAVYIAGAGAGNWPWALTSSSGAGGAILGGLYLSANATIGGENELKVGQTGDGYYCYLRGFTLTKTGEGAFTATNMNTPGTGTIDVQGGAMTVNQWNNLNSNGSGDTDVILRSGTSLENKADRIISMRTLTLDGGTLLTTSKAFKVKAILTGKGETAKLAFADGATINLTGELKVSSELGMDGSLTISTEGINPEEIAVGQTINLLTAPSETTLSADTVIVKASSRYDTTISGNTVKATVGDALSNPFLHYDFENGAAVDTGKAVDSRTQISGFPTTYGDEATDQTLVNSRNGKAICVHYNSNSKLYYTPWWDENVAGVSPFAAGEATVTTVAKLKETGVVLWGLGSTPKMGVVASNDTTVAVVVKNASGVVETILAIDGIYNLESGWHFIAVVARGDGTTLYVDDLSASTDKTIPFAIGQEGQFGSFHGGAIGAKKVGDAGYYLDDWRVYDAALTAKEIKALKRELNPDPLFIRLR